MKTLDDLLTMTDEEIAATPWEEWADDDARDAAGKIMVMFTAYPEEDDNPPNEPTRAAQHRGVEARRRPFRRALKAQLKAGLAAQERAALAELSRLVETES